MKASEWIAVLEELIEVCGDVDVTFNIEGSEITLRAQVDIDE